MYINDALFCELTADCLEWGALQMGSGRNFCIDIVLLCIVLAIALYIYNMVKSK